MKTDKTPAPKRVRLGSARTNTKALMNGDHSEPNHILGYP